MHIRGLAIFILQDVAVAAVEDAGPALRKAGGVFAGLESPAAGLGPHKSDLGVVDEGGEDPGGIRATADAGHHEVGQAADLLEALGPGLAADHRLEIAGPCQRGTGAGPTDAANRVMRGSPTGLIQFARHQLRWSRRAGCASRS